VDLLYLLAKNAYNNYIIKEGVILMRQLQAKTVFTVFLLFILALTGCTKEELQLISSIEKMANVKSYEAKSHVSFEMDFSGGDEYFQDSMYRFKQLIDNLEFNIQQKYEGDVTKNQIKAFMNMETVIEDFKFGADMWIDLDLQSDNPKYELIFKIPAIAKPFLPDEYNKDYLYIDYFALAGETFGPDYVKSFSSSFDYNQAFDLLGILDQMEGLSTDFVKASTTDDGSTKLTLTMTDAQLKSLILAVLEESKTNDLLLEYLTGIYNSSISASNPYAVAGSITVDGMRELFTLFLDDTLPLIEKYFAAAPILGEQGLVYEVVLDKNGYTVKETATVDMRIDVGVIEYLFSGYYTDSAIIECTVTAKNEYAKINEESSVSFPELTKENSIDLADSIKKQEEAMKEARKYYFPASYYYSEWLYLEGDKPVELPLAGTYNGGEVNTSMQILSPSDDFYYGLHMPLEQAVEIFGGELTLDEEMNIVYWIVNDESMAILTGDQSDAEAFYASDLYESIYYLEYGYAWDGTTFIPISSVEWFLNVDFGYDVDTNSILLR